MEFIADITLFQSMDYVGSKVEDQVSYLVRARIRYRMKNHVWSATWVRILNNVLDEIC